MQQLTYILGVALGALITLGIVTIRRRRKRKLSLIVPNERSWLSRIADLF